MVALYQQACAEGMHPGCMEDASPWLAQLHEGLASAKLEEQKQREAVQFGDGSTHTGALPAHGCTAWANLMISVDDNAAQVTNAVVLCASVGSHAPPSG